MKLILFAVFCFLSAVPGARAAGAIAGDGCSAAENGAATFLGYPTRVLTCNGTNWVVYASGSTQWTTSGSNIYYNTGNVSIGSTTANGKLFVNGTANFGTEGITNGDLTVANSVTVKAGPGGGILDRCQRRADDRFQQADAVEYRGQRQVLVAYPGRKQ